MTWQLTAGGSFASLTNVYTELHCHSHYSLLDGASSPAALVSQAQHLGMNALALTDHDSLSGAVEFWRTAHEQGLHPIIGAEVTVDGSHLTLLAEQQQGYSNLSRLLSLAHTAETGTDTWPGKTPPRLTWEHLNDHRLGLIALSGCQHSPIAAPLLLGRLDVAQEAASHLYEIFGKQHLFIELQRHILPQDTNLTSGLVQIARQVGVEIIATNNVHYAMRDQYRLQEVLVCIRHLTTLDDARNRGLLRPNNEYHLKSGKEMGRLFAGLPRAVSNTRLVAERCHVNLDWSRTRLPAFPVPNGHTAFSYLYHLCQEGLGRHINPVTPAASRQLARELDVIEKTGLAGFFLVIWDIVRFAQEQGIRYQGRGSAANSLVAYLLDITPVDPLQHHLLFERFLSEDSHTMPDIDVDVQADRREELIQYVYERWGAEHTAMVCNVNTFRSRSALRDVGRAFGLAPSLIDRLIRERQARDTQGTDKAANDPHQLFWELCHEIEGIPRHRSIHNGGMLITADPLVEIVPTERATMPERMVVQWDKASVEDAGLIKVDLLGLRTLGLVDEAARLIEAHTGAPPPLTRLPLDDAKIYACLCQADTIGTFQVESRAQAQVLPRLAPRTFEDIVVSIALIRPGPIQGNMVHPFLRRRQGLEPVQYPHPSLEPILHDTLGVVLFQEDVLRVAMTIASFSGGEADQLRRAMSRQRSHEEMARLKTRFVTGAGSNGVDEETAVTIFNQLAAFASYGFCKSHAAAFAQLAYQTLWLKLYHPTAFYCALLNQQPMGFYSPAVCMGDARRHGVQVLHPDVNSSAKCCTVEGQAVRLGFRYIKGLGPAAAERILTSRSAGPFTSLVAFCRQTRLPRGVVEHIIQAGALDCLLKHATQRRHLLWEFGALEYEEKRLALNVKVEEAVLPILTEAEIMGWEHELLGMSPGNHPMQLYRDTLSANGVLSSADVADCSDGTVVWVAGQAVIRQKPPTAKGHVFISLEDEWGMINLILRPEAYERCRDVVNFNHLLLARGRIQREGHVISLLVHNVVPLVNGDRSNV